MKIRKAAVAGRFYPGTPLEITRQLSQIMDKERHLIDLSLSGKKIIGAVLPHAGYMFSAYQAVHFFEILRQSKEVFDTFFIINPNHTGYGTEIALDENDFWATPFGKVMIDKDFYELLNIPVSKEAHSYEHSGEVLVPMLQYFLNYSFRIVPITLMKQNPAYASSLAKSIMDSNKSLQKKICILASSDFSHFVDPEQGRKDDQYVLDEIFKLSSKGIFNEVRSRNITVCGYGPIMTLVDYVLQYSGKPQMRILKRGHSGEIIPSSEVVDYISILFYEN
jgi:MEMO1 family protein